ncbi:transcription factor grauzone-like isoform X2 [Ceratitis capitata]|uniref:transcription factor grauzone-like isoform X2 n=1 Tax=Ceratitis capitata TaxID=7213 RepID=UPI000329DAB3|nr:transcription factor grauzone-like isoform X2 [Ceratitis capitata]
MICRLCLKEADCCLEIFDVNGEQLGIAEILKRHFWFQPLPSDTISTVICRICWLKVSDFHQFYLTVEQAHSLLNGIDVKHETVTMVINTVDFVQESIQIKEESLEFLHNAEQIEEVVNPLYEAEMDTSKNEDSENEVKLDEVKEETIVTKPDSDNSKVTSAKRKYVRKKTNAPKKVAKKEVEEDDKDSEEDDYEPEKPRRVKVITSSPQDDEMVKKHIPMGCDLCTFVGEDYIDMSKHFRLQHPNIKPYIRCCNRKLNKRFKVVQHAYKHEDPEFFKCQDCQKVFADRYTLKYHRNAAHAPEEDLHFACDQCPKKFARKYLLELHVPSHVPMEERSFICDQCPNSRFASNHLLKIHISMRHRRATNVCHVCAKEIRDRASFEKHVRLHFEDSGPRVKCPRPDCDSWLKDEENLRQHMRRHNDEGLTFKCEECGRTCKNRRALRSHILYVHSKEVFTCEECNKTFKKAITLREHMAQHTGESLYKCPFCTRTFNSNANMHSHKKKMHPAEWDIWRKTKQGSSQRLISKQQTSL